MCYSYAFISIIVFLKLSSRVATKDMEPAPLPFLSTFETNFSIEFNFTCPVSAATFLHKPETASFERVTDACMGKGKFQLDLFFRVGRMGGSPVVTMYTKPQSTNIGWHLASYATERETVRYSLADRICVLYPIAFEYRNEVTLLNAKTAFATASEHKLQGNDRISFALPQFNTDDDAIEISYNMDNDFYDYSSTVLKDGKSFEWRWWMKWDERERIQSYNCAPWGYNGAYFDHRKIPQVAFKSFSPSFAVTITKPKDLNNVDAITKVLVSFYVRPVAISGRVQNYYLCYKFSPQVYSNEMWIHVKRVISINWGRFINIIRYPPFSYPFDLVCYFSNYLCSWYFPCEYYYGHKNSEIGRTRLMYLDQDLLQSDWMFTDKICKRTDYVSNKRLQLQFVYVKNEYDQFFGNILSLRNTSLCLCYDGLRAERKDISAIESQSGIECQNDKCMWSVNSKDFRPFRNKLRMDLYLCWRNVVLITRTLGTGGIVLNESNTDTNTLVPTLCPFSEPRQTKDPAYRAKCTFLGPCQYWLSSYEQTLFNDSITIEEFEE